MKPKNNKTLISFLFDQMDKLDNDEINIEKAREQSNLAKQVNNAMKYELDRAKVKMELTNHNNHFGENLAIREVED